MSKIKCSNCGYELDSDSNFCVNCGKKVIKSDYNFCMYCGHPLELDSNFCVNCGKRVIKPKKSKSKIKNVSTSNKVSKESYEQFLDIQKDIIEFKNAFSKNEYLDNDLKNKLKKDYETKYYSCLKLKRFVDDSKVKLTPYELKFLNSFLNLYENIDKEVKNNNKKFIDKFYDKFIKNKRKYQDFINKYKLNASYEGLISEDVKKGYKNEYDLLKKLVDFEKNDGYDLRDNKKFIHEFIDLYDNFDEVVKDINSKVEKAPEIEKNYEKYKKDIENFISTYKVKKSTDLYIKNYEDILKEYKKPYDACLELSKLPKKYHKNQMREFLEIYDDFEAISQKINKNYISNKYNSFLKVKSKILKQNKKYQNLTVNGYLENSNDFLEKFKNMYDVLKELIELNFDFNKKELEIVNNFMNIYDDFNGKFPSKYYEYFLTQHSSLKTFLSEYGVNSKCSHYIFDKNNFLKDYSKLYDSCKDILKLKDAKKLVLKNNEEYKINSFIDIFDNFDNTIIKNNKCYVEKLKKEFTKQKPSMLEFINSYNKVDRLDYYISNEIKSKILKNNESNYNLASNMRTIPELSNDTVKEFINIYDNFDEIIFKINKIYVNELYNSNLDKIEEYVNIMNLSQNYYISGEKLKNLLHNHKSVSPIVGNLVIYCSKHDYLDDKSKLMKFPITSEELIHIIPDANESFIKRELSANKILLDNVVKGKPLDDKQRKAVVVDEDNTQIIAGAGCGKTLTLQAKAKYLIKRKNIPSENILAISYSKAAQRDLEEKMSQIGVDIDVSTFHSLGLDALRENNINPKVLEYGLNDAIEKYFLKKVVKDINKTQKIIEYFGYYMYNPLDKNEIKKVGEVYDYERGMDLETLYSKFEKLKDPSLKKTTIPGERVHSLEERRIANFLFINGVKYTYEKEYEAKIDWQKTHDYLGKVILKDIEVPKSIKNNLVSDLLDYLELDEVLHWHNGDKVKEYNPDFYLDDYDIYYEHFGVNRNYKAPWLSKKQSIKYRKQMKDKRLLHKKYGTKLIETYSYYQSENRLLDRLREKLIECGVEFKQINYQDFMIRLLKDKEKINEYWDFIKLVKTFINLFKGNGYKKEKFKEFRKDNEKSYTGFLKEKHKLFLDIVEDIYDYYQDYLKKNNAIDFNDMINNATEIIEKNDYHKNYEYIMVDEYQDTSYTRFNFLKTLKDKLNSKLIVVGDDWQSIYRFTGCDIDLFTNFKNYFDDSKTEICYITNTYRNSQSLIDVSGKFIRKNESQSDKKLNSKSKEQIDDSIKLYEYLNNVEQPFVFEIMINDIYESSNENDVEILVLGRNRKDYKQIINDELFYTTGNLDNKNLKIHYKKNPNISMRYMTVHGSKGLEEDNVILINLEDKKDGFPNKVEDDSVLSFVKNEKIEPVEFAEERRLFYVALTRTMQRTYLLAPKDKKSIFVDEIIDDIEVVDYEINKDYEIYDDKIRVIASTDERCPQCGTGKIKLLFNPKTGKKFFKCSNWPKCDWFGGRFYGNVKELKNPKYCKKCGGLMVKKEENGPFYGCINYFSDKACRHTEKFN